ncbi:hypothetical protein HY484_02050 [Candidatus Woesearchaeota archaeon]|nr:hypothetical protein [Candidatus Woesearchaeota archaeon]
MYKPFKAVRDLFAGKEITRRDLGIGVLEGIALFSAAKFVVAEEQSTPANEYLNQFPASIPKASSVEKHETKDPVSVTVYGAAHDWKDNIVEWNKLHPDKKFSLIVVTPEALAKHFGEALK